MNTGSMTTTTRPRPAINLVTAAAAFSLLVTLAAAPAAYAQPTFTKSFTPATIGPGNVSTATFIINNTAGGPVTAMGFTDALPAVVDVADPPNAWTDCAFDTGGSLSATAGESTITLSNAMVGTGGICTVRVDVTSTSLGAHTNPAITLSTSAGSDDSDPTDLTIDPNLPGFLKSFTPASISIGGRSTLTFTIDNTLGPKKGSLDFIDNLPFEMVVADPANASTDCVSVPLNDTTLTAVPGTSVIILDANGTTILPGFEVLPAGATCTVTVDVTATGSGLLLNQAELLADFVPSGKASATLDVTSSPLLITKEFTDDPVPPGDPGTLVFSIFNYNRSYSATDVAFTDDLAAALSGLTWSPLSNTCGGTLLGDGTSFVDFSGGVIAPEGSCTITVSLAVPGSATAGTYINTTSTVSATVDGSPVVGNTATDWLFVEPVPLLTKEFLDATLLTPDPVVNAGDDVVIRFTVSNTSTTSSATAIAFIDELTDGSAACPPDPTSGFLPFPVSVVLPTDPCGVGSTITTISVDTDRQGLSLAGGTLDVAPSTCTFDVTVTLPVGLAPGIYTNTTEEITATVDGATRTGEPASDTLTVVGAPRLVKAFTDDPVVPGGTVTLEFTLTHPPDAPGIATGIAFTDDLNAALVGLAANLPATPDPPCGAGSTLTGSVGDTLLTFAGGSLTPGQACTFSVTLDVPIDAAPGTYTNTTSGVSATVNGVPATSQAVSDELKVAGLTFAKEFVDDPVVPGETVTLRFTIENTDPTDDASSIQFSDDLSLVLPGTPDLTVSGPLPTTPCGPSSSITGTTSLDFNGGELAQGASCTFDVTLQVPAGAPDGTFTNATGILIAILGGSMVIIDPATAPLVVNSNFLQLTKEFTDDPVEPGDPATLRFTLTNLDGANQASTIAFTDVLSDALPGLVATGLPFAACGGTVDAIPDSATIDFSGGVLGPGVECFFDVTVDVPGSALGGDYANTTSEVTGLINGLAVTGGPATDKLTVFNMLDFSKSFDGPTVAGGTAVLTFTITNPGSTSTTYLDFSDDLNAVIPGLVATNLPLSDVCGAGSELAGTAFITLTGGNLPPSGGTCSFDVDVLVPVTADPGGHLNVTSELFDSGLQVADPATATLTIEPPPLFTKVFAPDAVAIGAVSTLTFTIDNSAGTLAATDLDFTDNLPSGLLVATPPNASTTCTGGTLTANAGGATISYTGGTVAAGASCTVQADVVNSTSGFFNNTSGDLTSSSGNSGTANDTLAVDPPPGFHKSFSPNKIAIGGVSTLTFTINNSLAVSDATGLDFADNLPADVVIATPSNASTTCTSGTLTAADGTGVITYTGGTVTAGTTCTVQVDVTSSVVGTHPNVSSDLTSSLGNSGKASANLRVNPPPGFSKAFAPDPSIIGGVVTLTFTIDNSGSTAAANNLDFTDNLPAALLVATPANVVNDCGGAVTATEGTATIILTGGEVAAFGVCTLAVDVTSTAAGDHVNTTGELTSSLTSSGTATATLRVNPPPVFSKAFVPSSLPLGDVGTLVFSINNTASTADATDLDFLDNMPVEITVADPPNATTDCDGGIITAEAGTSTIAYTGGIVPAETNCTLSVDITSSVLGPHDNTSSALTSSLGDSDPAEATLTVVDPEGPEVTSVTTSAGPLNDCDTVRLLIPTINVTVTDARTPVLNAGASASYLLVEAGADADLSTTDCAGGASGDDVLIGILGVTLDDTDPLAVVATVEVADADGLAPGMYRFFVCDTITDTAGNPLDGGDFQIPFFRADPGNRLVNGHFDDCPATLDPWTATAVLPNVVQIGAVGTDDHLGSPLSAGAVVMQSTNDPSLLSQCAEVEGEVIYDFESWLFFDSPSGALALFSQTCEYFDAAGCTGTSLGESSFVSLLEGSGASWIFNETLVQTAPGAISAHCVFEASPFGTESDFYLYLDGLFFGAGDFGEIFSDGFESGNTSAWSSTVP